MATDKSPAAWSVLPHGALEQLEANLWRAEGTLPGMPLKRVMTVARLGSGELVVHNAIALDEPQMAALDALGRVAFIVVPNGWHRLDAAQFARRYPAARVLAPRGAQKKVAKVVASVGALTELPADPGVQLAPVDGMREGEAMMIVRAGGRTTIVFADAVFNMPHGHGFHGWVLRHVTGSSGGPRVSRIARLFMIKDKAAFRAQLERLATPDLARVIVAHHEVITDDPAGALRAVAATL